MMLSISRSTRLIAGALSMLAPASAFAQPTQSCPIDPIPDGIEYEFDLPGTVHGDSCTGEFTGDLQLDIALLIDSELVIYHSPGLIDYVIHPDDLGTPITAICSLNGGGPAGIDRVVGSDAGGLLYWSLDTVVNEVDPVRISSSSAAANASAVMTADLDGQNGDDIIAVNSSLNQVTYWYAQSNGTFTLGYTYTATESITEAFVGDWVAGGNSELILVHTGRLSVIDTLTSTEVETLSFVGTAQYAALLNETTVPGVAIALIEERGANPSHQWMTLWRAGGQSETGLNLGTMGITAMTSSDVNADGNDDPTVTTTTSPWLLLFTNQITVNQIVNGPSLNINFAYASEYSAYGLTHTNQCSTPISADLDGDGDLDTAVACTLTGKLDINLNGLLISESSKRINFEGHNHIVSDAKTSAVLPKEYFVLMHCSMPALIPANYTHIDFTLREQQTTDTIDQVSIEILPSDSIFTITLGTGLDLPVLGDESFITARYVRRVEGVDREYGPPLIAQIKHAGACGNQDGATSPPPIPVPIIGTADPVMPIKVVPDPPMKSPVKDASGT